MTKRTTTLEKKTFIGLVINKLANTGHNDLIHRIEAKSNNLGVEYKTAQRYARDYIYVRTGEQEKLFKDLEELMKKQVLIESEAEAPSGTTKAEKEAYVGLVIEKLREKGTFTSSIKKIENKRNDLDLQYKTAQKFAHQWLNDLKLDTNATSVALVEKPVAPVKDTVPPEPYLKLASWFVAIDKGLINGTVSEAKEFISTIDGYTDKLQTLVVDQTKAQLKVLLQKVKECESVLDKSEVENIWLEVGTENSELVVTPYSREIALTPVQKLPSPVESDVEPSSSVAL